MELSVVIPTLIEAADRGALLECLSRKRGVGEVVVADGGSTDGTPELVVSSSARLVRARPGWGDSSTPERRRLQGTCSFSCTPTSRRRRTPRSR
jgi:glycosyltransferase involved in cell wall biosynthesis